MKKIQIFSPPLIITNFSKKKEFINNFQFLGWFISILIEKHMYFSFLLHSSRVFQEIQRRWGDKQVGGTFYSFVNISDFHKQKAFLNNFPFFDGLSPCLLKSTRVFLFYLIVRVYFRSSREDGGINRLAELFIAS